MTSEIRWPERFLPAHAGVFVSNEITIAAPPEDVWQWLIRAELWPQWYPKSSNIHFISTSGPNLRERSRFRWNTFGVRITCKVLEFEPFVRLAWEAQGIGVDAYHGWLLTPTEDGGTHVLTQETQHGWLARLGKLLTPGRMVKKHQMWVETLKQKAESRLPPELAGMEKARAAKTPAGEYLEG